jgi:hypothetical protein
VKIEWRDVFWGDRFGRVLHAEKPYQNGRLLEGEALYLALDRPDLAEAYRDREETQMHLAVISVIAFAGSVLATGIAAADHGGRGAWVVAGGSFVLFGAFGIGAGAYSPDVLTEDELHQLVAAHNQPR